MACASPIPALQDSPGSPVKFNPPLGTANLAISCGQCVLCRLERSRQWALRIEAHRLCFPAEQCHFLTLTYDDAHLPPRVGDRHTLVPKDLTDFWKRLRKRFPSSKMSYFACGEYGSRTLRPHYHACVFGLNLVDLIPMGAAGGVVRVTDPLAPDAVGTRLTRSPILDAVWSRGAVARGEVTFQSAGYVARYIMSKQLGKARFNPDTYREYFEEFQRQSTKPAIGDLALDKFPRDWFNMFHDFDESTSIPKRYLKRLKAQSPALYDNYLQTRASSGLTRLSSAQLRSLEINRLAKLGTSRGVV